MEIHMQHLVFNQAEPDYGMLRGLDKIRLWAFIPLDEQIRSEGWCLEACDISLVNILCNHNYCSIVSRDGGTRYCVPNPMYSMLSDEVRDALGMERWSPYDKSRAGFSEHSG